MAQQHIVSTVVQVRFSQFRVAISAALFMTAAILCFAQPQLPALPSLAEDPELNYRLALSHYVNQQDPVRLSEAIKLLSSAADSGHTKAQGLLGLCFATGRGVVKDPVAASLWLRKAAEKNDAIAQYSLGNLLANGTGVEMNATEAVAWYRKAAEQGHAAAQHNLAAAMEAGRGTTENAAEAAGWYKKAANQGFAQSQTALGMMLSSGRSVPKNMVEAAQWYQKAADTGDSHAQFLIGVNYFFGYGIAEDWVQSYKWLELAASQKHAEARQHQRTVEAKLTPQQKTEAQKLIKLYRDAQTSKPIQTSFDPLAPTKPSGLATGTGVFITEDGYLLTSHHVVADALRCEVLTKTGRVLARVVKSNLTNDLAILQISGRHKPIPLGDSTVVRLGHQVFTVGFPNVSVQGLEPKFTDGRINGISGIQDDPRHFQISVPVQPGNSGGALVNDHGQVIGIVTFRLDDIKTFNLTGSLPQNVSYALKSSLALDFIKTIPELTDKLPAGIPAQNRPFEEIVKAAQEAAVLILTYR
ncbi:MAG: trypsin-like serine protease [Pedosphaera sp.]|nr:trypsin-like serine protease [Pedosphaera sp.]